MRVNPKLTLYGYINKIAIRYRLIKSGYTVGILIDSKALNNRASLASTSVE